MWRSATASWCTATGLHAGGAVNPSGRLATPDRRPDGQLGYMAAMMLIHALFLGKEDSPGTFDGEHCSTDKNLVE